MTRTPLRPLARILEARAKGENPDAIERENLRLRHEAMRDRARNRPRGGCWWWASSSSAPSSSSAAAWARWPPRRPKSRAGGGGRRDHRAARRHHRPERAHPRHEPHHPCALRPAAADGRPRARRASCAHLPRPRRGEAPRAVHRRAEVPLDQAPHLARADAGGPRHRRPGPAVRPARDAALPQRAAGEPCPRRRVLRARGRAFGRGDRRGGVEKAFDDFLRDPANDGRPLQLSLDLSVQAVVEEVLAGGMRLMNAKGATAILMDATRARSSAWPRCPTSTRTTARPLPTRATRPTARSSTGRCRGSTSSARPSRSSPSRRRSSLGLVNPETMIDTRADALGPLPDQRLPQLRPEMTVET
jgi:cell division protein FtsI (penicillin-binding protein 3)